MIPKPEPEIEEVIAELQGKGTRKKKLVKDDDGDDGSDSREEEEEREEDSEMEEEEVEEEKEAPGPSKRLKSKGRYGEEEQASGGDCAMTAAIDSDEDFEFGTSDKGTEIMPSMQERPDLGRNDQKVARKGLKVVGRKR